MNSDIAYRQENDCTIIEIRDAKFKTLHYCGKTTKFDTNDLSTLTMFELTFDKRITLSISQSNGHVIVIIPNGCYDSKVLIVDGYGNATMLVQTRLVKMVNKSASASHTKILFGKVGNEKILELYYNDSKWHIAEISCKKVVSF